MGEPHVVTLRATRAADLDELFRFRTDHEANRMAAFVAKDPTDRAAFDAALLEQERAYAIDLKIANNPARVKAPEDGIPIEGRGLLYYVILR